ncbi:hypothetical protein [Tessaracoccus palaemonis]|uniref:Uncharacterized protein n=1 Tax=Tessaracoccus palaemonis TaxID=2829499 RepID=A0ABX8SL51_9ACTN|nr:hypothetical protein [Tessaracoccus palaemonis]QXT62728.1 hypothetical protein KDB89_13495 [Tessaracoccus palaemonis]
MSGEPIWTIIDTCTHGVTHHHGTRLGYIRDHCRCDACRAAAAHYEQARRRRNAYGRSHLVDATPARQHVRALMAQGMGWKRIATFCGVAASTLGPILYGAYPDQPNHPDHRPPRLQISRELSAKLLAVGLDVAPGVRVDATGVRRRVQALVAAGWSKQQIARRLGIAPGNMNLDIAATVTGNTRDRVIELYNTMRREAPPADDQYGRSAATRSRNYAQTRGWVTADAWDAESIDNPRATPMPTDPASVAARRAALRGRRAA